MLTFSSGMHTVSTECIKSRCLFCVCGLFGEMGVQSPCIHSPYDTYYPLLFMLHSTGAKVVHHLIKICTVCACNSFLNLPLAGCVLYFLLTVLDHSLDVESTLPFCSHSFQAVVCIIMEHTHAKLNLHFYNPETQDGGGGV